MLALGQVPADAPEDFAAIATLRRARIARRTRISMAPGFAAPILLGTTLGHFALRQAPEILTLSALTGTGAALTSVVVEKMLTEAHKDDTSARGSILFTGGVRIIRGDLRLRRLLRRRTHRSPFPRRRSMSGTALITLVMPIAYEPLGQQPRHVGTDTT